jgi:outer membrane biosynthesis protein TonB
MQIPAMSDDVSRYSDLIPRPAKAQSLDTPWPPESNTLDKPIQQIALTPPPARKPWALYGVAAFGLVAGGAGLMFGLTGGDKAQPIAAVPPPAPAITQPLPAAATTPAPREVAPAKIQVTLNASVPNARVTFRRRVTAAPAEMSITPSDIVELVEVSAPGYKTVRYWLTFDRPTSLTARLTKGSGLVEASEEQTLVALGELAAPAMPAVAAAAAPVVETPAPKAKTVGKTVAKTAPEHVAAAVKTPTETPAAAKTVPTPRKIGRGTMSTEEAEAKAETAVASTEAPTQVEPPKVEPKPLVPVAKPEPKPAPVAAVAKPAIDYATINSVVSKHRVEILKCYAAGAKQTPGLKGTISLQLQVDPSGKVRAQVQSTLSGAPTVAACVIKAACSWSFPARPGSTEIANVTYPFKFGG